MVLTGKKTVFLDYYESKFGKITLVASDTGLMRVSLPLKNSSGFEKRLVENYNVIYGNNSILDQAKGELEEFFSYARKKFEVPFDLQDGTDFQRGVWNELLKIPYGRTYSYKQIAMKLNNPGAVRAVGLANKANPLPLFIPCHRVIGSNGALVGYAGNDPENLKFKDKLLSFEKNKNSLLNFSNN